MPFPTLPKRVLSALKVLVCLTNASGPTRACELSKRTGIPFAQTAKILYMLTWRGMVTSRRGSNGGFWLRIPPQQIRVQDVVKFFLPPNNRGPEDSRNSILHAWRETVAPGGRIFVKLTLADLTKRERIHIKPRARPSNSSLACAGLLALGFLLIPGSQAPGFADGHPWLSAGSIKPVAAHSPAGGQGGTTADTNVVGSEKCAECHPEIASFYRTGTHNRPFFWGVQGGGCESCHGPGGKHAESADPADILNREEFRKLRAPETSERCLSCHRSNVRHIQGWFLSQHARAEVSCWDCHGEVLHHLAKDGKALPASSFLPNSKERIQNLFMANPNEFCYRCHERQRLEFALPFRHPLERGKMACVDCHNPHGEEWRQQVATHSVENESDALCFRCHAEQRGPFVWQHQAMEEGCTACHRPHGSPNRRLLRISGNALCLQCHFERQFPTLGRSNHQSRLSRFARCVDCHIRTHGSNVSEDLTQ